MSDKKIAILIACVGAAYYFFLDIAGYALKSTDGIGSGAFVYNYYFLSLIDGHLDIPARVIGLEGHYDAQGQAFIYHGLVPLVTRLFAWPFVDLEQVSLAKLTVWIFAAGGTALYHFSFYQVFHAYRPKNTRVARVVGAGFGVAIWFASAGVIAAANRSFYHEPVAAAYFLVAGFMALCVPVFLGRRNIAAVIIALSVVAGLCVHARPHLAIGLYLGVALFIVVMILLEGRKTRGLAIVATGILLGFGAAFLWLNLARFGGFLVSHGSMSGQGVQYGFFYWGSETPGVGRSQAFTDYGPFYAPRMPLNLITYLFDIPLGFVADIILEMRLTAQKTIGYMRIETPRVGIMWLWMPWMLLIAAGFRPHHNPMRLMWVAVCATSIGALFILSFLDVTFRHRVDIWPLVFVLALMSLPALQTALSSGASFAKPLMWLFLVAAIAGLASTNITTAAYSTWFRQTDGNRIAWTYTHCAELVEKQPDLGTSDIHRICARP